MRDVHIDKAHSAIVDSLAEWARRLIGGPPTDGISLCQRVIEATASGRAGEHANLKRLANGRATAPHGSPMHGELPWRLRRV